MEQLDAFSAPGLILGKEIGWDRDDVVGVALAQGLGACAGLAEGGSATGCE